MNFFQITNLNFKKLKKYRTKALFLMVPITILVTLSLIVSSSTKNVENAVDKSIFGTINEQLRLIELSKFEQGNNSKSGGRVMMRFEPGQSMNYSQSDLDTISALSGVQTADISSPLSVSNITTTNLFTNINFSITSLTGLSSEFGKLYTDQNFEYQADQPIPIILNASSFVERYEDWGGKDEIKVTINRTRTNNGGNAVGINMKDQNPVKTKAIDYNKGDLIGKEFTVTIGGLDAIENFSQTFDDTGMTFKKLTQDEINAKETARKDALSPYWNYDKLKETLTFTFKIVGITEKESDMNNYVPEGFANALMKQYIQHQLDARTATAIPTDLLNTTFRGITYDGVEISSGNTSFGGKPMMVRMGERVQEEQTDSFNIPGLVIETERSQSGGNPFGPQATALGVYTNPSVYEEAAKSGTTIIIKTSDVYSRKQVVEELNKAGYAYQDLQDQDVLTKIRDNVHLLTVIFTIAFIALTIMIIIFTMGKFVSESKKEIGIMRAIGATKGEIRNLFVSQAVLYTLISYTIGTAIGLVVIFGGYGILSAWFDSVVGQSLRDTFSVVNPVPTATFRQIDLISFGYYSLALLVITLIISVLPATRASNISPVEAIKGE